jgi:Flp pilus assembly protein TadG
MSPAVFASRVVRLRQLARAADGIAATEFGLIAPAMFVLLFGALDTAHTLYMKSVLQGAVQKAGRDATLQSASGTSAAARDALDQKVRDQVNPLKPGATMTFTRRSYRTFSQAAAAAAETFTDSASGTFHDGVCNNNESFNDLNSNGFRDLDGGDSVGNAGARDNLVYTVTVSYPELFPIHRFIGGSTTTTISASTVLSNQPYGEQNAAGPSVGHCP